MDKVINDNRKKENTFIGNVKILQELKFIN